MKRILAAMVCTLALSVFAIPANAQRPGVVDPPPETAPGEEGSSGDPLYGYVGTAFFAALAVFAVCKSSRR